jgi:predicted RNA binding protein YcfA (HicA-like mRNA interferase family)
MGDIDKLVERICRRPPEARFDDVRRMLEAFGWDMRRQKGSHVTFVKTGRAILVISKHNEKVKRAYLDDICEQLGLEL